MSTYASPHVKGRFEHGEYVVDVEDDRSLTIWSTESGDAMTIPAHQVRAVLFLLCAAYVGTGRFGSDKDRKAYVESLAVTS